MKKIAILILSILIAGLFVACNQDVTVDAQTYANMEVGTFVLNGQNYATLQEAVNAKLGKSAKAVGGNDGVIYLTRNASGPGAVIDVSGTPVIIDFAGYTYSFTNVTGLQGGDNPQADTFGLGITNGADVTLKGLQKIDLNDKTTTDLTMVYVEGATTSLTIEDAPKMEVANSQYVFWAANGATLTIGSTAETGTTSISGKMAATGTGDSKPVVTVNNATEMSVAELKADNAVIVVNTSAATTVSSLIASNAATVVVSGTGSVTVEKNDSPADADYEVQNTSSSATVKIPTTNSSGEATETTIQPGKQIDVEEGKTTHDEPQTSTAVARIGSVLFDSLRLAISTASRGDTVVLLKDISVQTEASTIHEYPIGKACFPVDTQIDIDGGGHVITASGDGGGYVFYFMNTSVEDGVTYTMKDLKIESTHIQAIVMTNQWDDPFDNDLVQLTNIEITCDGECAYINGFTHFSAENCKFSQNGEYASGKDAVYYSAVIVGYGGTATLNDCTVESFKNGVATFPSGGTINLYNTSLTVTSESTFAFWSRIGNGSTTSSEYSDSIINVFSGNYSGEFELTDTSTIHDAYIFVTGGTFDADPSAYVADGYVAEYDSETQLWTVVEDTPEVKITKEGEQDKTMSLASFRNKVNAGNSYAGYTVTLLCDVDLEGIEWTPIGSYSDEKTFNGVFDGNGKSITNIKIEGIKYGALFSNTKDATIKNLTLSGTSTNSDSYSEGLVGVCAGNTLIDSVTVDVTINSKGTNTGGFVGRNDGTLVIQNCENKGSISADGQASVGGILGWLNEGSSATIINCINRGDITNISSGASGIAGATTKAGTSLTIINCQNYGTITANADNAGGFTTHGSSSSGIQRTVVIKTDSNYPGNPSANYGAVHGKVYAGGIVGTHDGNNLEIIGVSNNGSVTGAYAGGIIGNIQGGAVDSSILIKNCDNSGLVTANEIYNNKSVAGGVIGYMGTARPVTVDGCSGGEKTISITSDVSPEGQAKGRLVGLANNSAIYDVNHSAGLILKISDNSDDYTDISSVGKILHQSGGLSLSYITVESGTLIGDVKHDANGYLDTSGPGWRFIYFKQNTAWRVGDETTSFDRLTSYVTKNGGAGWIRFELATGKSRSIYIEGVDAGYSQDTKNNYTWTSSDPTIATVTNSNDVVTENVTVGTGSSENVVGRGVVTGLAPGYVTITATNGDFSYSISMYITNPD